MTSVSTDVSARRILGGLDAEASSIAQSLDAVSLDGDEGGMGGGDGPTGNGIGCGGAELSRSWTSGSAFSFGQSNGSTSTSLNPSPWTRPVGSVAVGAEAGRGGYGASTSFLASLSPRTFARGVSSVQLNGSLSVSAGASSSRYVSAPGPRSVGFLVIVCEGALLCSLF